MTRQSKTPRQRAEEQLAVEERRVERLTTRVDALRAELLEAEGEWTKARTRRDYLRQHPDLGSTPTTTSTGDTQ